MPACIAVIQAEGAAMGALLEADVVVKDLVDAFDLRFSIRSGSSPG